MDPLAPAGTIAALAMAFPSGAFRVDTSGRGIPVGHSVRKPRPVGRGTTVALNEYAFAMVGIPHTLPRTGMVREVMPAMLGGPNAPEKPEPTRVSINRQGDTATNVRKP